MKKFLTNKLFVLIVAFGSAMVLFLSFVFFTNLYQPDIVELNGTGSVYDEFGIVKFSAGDEYTKEWSDATTLNNEPILENIPIVFDDNSLIIPEEAVAIFPDSKNFVYIPPFSKVELNASSYEIYSPNNQVVLASAPEMLIKTNSDYIVSISSQSIISNGSDEIIAAPIVISQLNEDETVTIFSDSNKSFIAKDVVLETELALFDYEELMYEGEYSTNLALLDVNEVSDLDDRFLLSSTGGGGDAFENTNPTDSEGESSSSNASSSSVNDAAPSGIIVGLQAFLDAFFDSSGSSTPTIDTAIAASFSTITVTLDVFDPTASIVEEIEVTLYDENNKIAGYKVVDPNKIEPVVFEDLKSEKKYRVNVSTAYLDKDGEQYFSSFFDSVVFTTRIQLDFEIVHVDTDLIRGTLRTKHSDDITSGTISLIEEFTGNEIDSININPLESNGLGGQDITFANLESGTLYSINIFDVTIGNNTIDSKQTIIQSTKKTTPTVDTPIVVVDQLESLFKVISVDINDPDNSIEEIIYEVWTVGPTGDNEYVTSIVKNAASINEKANIFVDGVAIERNKPYQFRTTLRGNNNAYNYEVSSGFSGNYVMAGINPPLAAFYYDPVTDVGFNYVDFLIDITDSANAIIGVPKLEIYRGDQKLAYSRNLAVGDNQVKVDSLLSLNTYRFEVVATVDLQDGHGAIVDVVIGTTLVKLKSVGQIDVSFEMNPSCPLIDPSLPPSLDNYDSCIGTDFAVVKTNLDGESRAFIQELAITFKNKATGGTQYVMYATDLEILDAIADGFIRVKVPITTLTSDTNYEVSISRITDMVNDIPITINGPNDFATKKAEPIIQNLTSTYNEGLGEIIVEFTDILDRDRAYTDTYIQLYEYDPIADVKGNLVSEIISQDPEEVAFNFEVDGVNIERGKYYKVYAKTQYYDNYTATYSTAVESSLLTVDYDQPTVSIELNTITPTTATFEIYIDDIDDVLKDANENIIIKDRHGNQLGAPYAITKGQTQQINFTGLNIFEDHSLEMESSLTMIETVEIKKLLDYEFSTPIVAAELPKLSNTNVVSVPSINGIEYDYTLTDLHHRSFDVSVKNYIPGDVVSTYSYALSVNSGTASGDFPYYDKRFYKNQDYKTKIETYYTNVVKVSPVANTEYALQIEDGRYLNGTNSLFLTPVITKGANVILEPEGSGVFKIAIGDVDEKLYLSTDYTTSMVDLSDKISSSNYRLENNGGVYHIIDDANGFYMYEIAGKLFMDQEPTQAVGFSFYEIEKDVSVEYNIHVPSATLPTVANFRTSITENSIDVDFDILDTFNLIDNDEDIELVLLNEQGVLVSSVDFEFLTGNNFLFDNLTPATSYTIKINGLINRGEVFSTDETYTIYSEDVETRFTPPAYTGVTAVWDSVNLEIVLSPSLVDSNGIYKESIVVIRDSANNIISTTIEPYDIAAERKVTIDYVTADPQLLINNNYRISLAFRDKNQTPFNTHYTTVDLDYEVPNGAVLNVAPNSGAIDFATNVMDPQAAISGNPRIELINITSPMEPVINKAIGIGYDTHSFVDLEFSSDYDIVLYATYNVDARGTFQEVELFKTTTTVWDQKPSVVAVSPAYIRGLEQLQVTFYTVVEEAKITTIDLKITDLTINENLIFEQSGIPYMSPLFVSVPANLLPVGALTNVVLEYHYTLLNGETNSFVKNSILIPSTKSMPKTMSFQSLVFEEEVSITVFDEDGTTEQYDNINMIELPQTTEKIIVNEEQVVNIEIPKTEVKQEVEITEPLTEYRSIEGYEYKYAGDGEVIVIDQEANFFSKLFRLNKDTYNSQNINQLVIDKDERENYSIELLEGAEK